MVDPEDKKPAGYDDIPAEIPDPEATKPDDWDDEEDGEWEAPMVDNPAYKGPWKPKMIPNPAYKYVWHISFDHMTCFLLTIFDFVFWPGVYHSTPSTLSPQTNFILVCSLPFIVPTTFAMIFIRGEWEHPMIPNPEYKEDKELHHRCEKCTHVGFELWQVSKCETLTNKISHVLPCFSYFAYSIVRYKYLMSTPASTSFVHLSHPPNICYLSCCLMCLGQIWYHLRRYLNHWFHRWSQESRWGVMEEEEGGRRQRKRSEGEGWCRICRR